MNAKNGHRIIDELTNLYDINNKDDAYEAITDTVLTYDDITDLFGVLIEAIGGPYFDDKVVELLSEMYIEYSNNQI